MKTAYKPVVKLAAAAAAAFFAVSSIQVPVTALAYTKPAGSHVLTPIASGVTTYSNEKATLDASNVSEGYIMVKYTGSVGKIKVQITKSGSETYTYDLSSSGVYEVFPLSEGSGSYSVKVFENIQGNQYSQAFSQNVNATITNQFGPFLYPNQYVNFNAASAAVQTGASVAASATDQLGVVSNVYNYVINNVTYDTAKQVRSSPAICPMWMWFWRRKRESVLTTLPYDSHAQVPGHSHQAGGGLYGESVSRLD